MTTSKENLQELFNTSLEHIRKQGKPSIDERGLCFYRGPDGLQCAAGPFVTDSVPEGAEFGELSPSFFVKEYSEEEVMFIKQLQSCHDSAVILSVDSDQQEQFLPVYENRMKSLANREGLKYIKP